MVLLQISWPIKSLTLPSQTKIKLSIQKNRINLSLSDQLYHVNGKVKRSI